MRQRTSLAFALLGLGALIAAHASGDDAPGMRILRFHDTPDGGSRFEEVEIAFPQPYDDAFGNTYHLSRAVDAQDAIFVELPAGLAQSWHNAPHRQFVIVLRGALEVETTDGAKRRWGTGDVFMADDVRGKGHLTRVLEGPARLLFIRLPEDFNLAEWTR